MTEKYNGKKIGSEEEKLTGLSSKMQDNVEENNERYAPYGNLLRKMSLFTKCSMCEIV